MANVDGDDAVAAGIQSREQRLSRGNGAVVLRAAHVKRPRHVGRRQQPQPLHVPLAQHRAQPQVLLEAQAGQLARRARSGQIALEENGLEQKESARHAAAIVHGVHHAAGGAVPGHVVQLLQRGAQPVPNHHRRVHQPQSLGRRVLKRHRQQNRLVHRRGPTS